MKTSDRMQYFTIFQDKLHSIFRTINCGLLAKPLKTFPISPIRLASTQFWRTPNLQWPLIELLFNIIENLLFLIFYSMVLYGCVILKSVWYARYFEYSCEQCSWTTENERHSDKIARETTYNQWKKYNSVKHLQRQQLSFTITSIKVFLKILSLQA